MSIDNGGPAFPVPGLMDDESFNGMTLRDYFAAKAMQGYCAIEAGWIEPAEEVARCTYAMADAMLKARKNTA